MLSLWANWLQLNSQLNSLGVSFWLYHIPPILGIGNHWFKKTILFPRLSQEIFPRQNTKKYVPPFPWKWEHACNPSCVWGGGEAEIQMKWVLMVIEQLPPWPIKCPEGYTQYHSVPAELHVHVCTNLKSEICHGQTVHISTTLRFKIHEIGIKFFPPMS